MIRPEPLCAPEFAPFGEVIEVNGEPDKIINRGRCGRFHDLARLDIDKDAVGISLFASDLVELPMALDLMERHPLGSQAFLPMSESRFLVIVAPDEGGRPGPIRAFLAAPGQGVNIARNTWHAVLCPLDGSGLYAVIDYTGTDANLEEATLDPPVQIGD